MKNHWTILCHRHGTKEWEENLQWNFWANKIYNSVEAADLAVSKHKQAHPEYKFQIAILQFVP